MFMMGQGERIEPVGPLETHDCPGCAEAREFEPRVRYKFGKFDLLFGFVYRLRYELACTGCGHGWLLDRKEAERHYGRPHIPLRLRYGAVVLAVVVAGLAGAALVMRGGIG